MFDPRPDRRGSYNALLGLMLPITIGFLALAVDTSWIQLASSQAQDVADAASHAALIQLRKTGSTGTATTAANTVIASNLVGGDNASLGTISFGYWDREDDTFDTTALRPNAVNVELGRYDEDPIDLTFARIWGRNTATVNAAATSATRSLHIVLVMDITGSFAADIHHARDAAIAFLDILDDSHGKEDKIGMATFYNVYGHERSPLTFFEDTASITAMRADWNTLDIASRIRGDMPPLSNDGPNPQMPRHYDGEDGTDHHVGMVMARQMLANETDPFAYRAIVLLTDGRPDSLGKATVRTNIGYVETRWNEYKSANTYSRYESPAIAIQQAELAWSQQNAHVWTVTFKETNAFLKDMVQGDGKYYYTPTAAELVPIFEEIARSMPLVIVK